MGELARRDLMRAGAWTLPVVAFAAAAPAATASPTGSTTITVTAAYQVSDVTRVDFFSVIGGNVRDSLGRPAAGVVLTATFVPSLDVLTFTSSDEGSFAFVRRGSAFQTSYQVTAPDGSSTGLRSF